MSDFFHLSLSVRSTTVREVMARCAGFLCVYSVDMCPLIAYTLLSVDIQVVRMLWTKQRKAPIQAS